MNIPTIHEFYFTSPGWLWLLALVPPALWLRSRGKNLRFRLLQIAASVLLILAAAAPEIQYDSTHRTRLILLEVENENEDENINGNVNGNASETLPQLPEKYAGWEVRRFSGSTAAALAGAAMEIPDGGGSIHLVGRLRETDHALDAILETLNRRRLSVTAQPATTHFHETPSGNEKTLHFRSISYPASAGCGATAAVEIELEAEEAGEALFAIRSQLDGRVVAEKRVSFEAGDFHVTLPLPLPEPGLFRGQLEIDQHPGIEMALHVRDTFRAVLFSREPEREFAGFNAVLNKTVRLETYRSGMSLDDVPLLIFAPGAATELPEELQREIIRQAECGAGILAVAGREALFAGESVLPEFASLFPARYPGTQENRIPTVALAIVIDTSGSMRGVRLDLARETARLAISGLQENDLAGIVEFHGTRRWAAPLQSAANQFSLMRALNRLNAGGGTVILPAVHEAYYALRNTDARLKHLLILTDGGVEYGDFESIIRKMARHDITVSTVLVGPGESDFLGRIAMWGSGRFYRASSRFALPELRFRKQENLPLPPTREKSLEIIPVGNYPLTADLPPHLSVGGVVKSVPAEDAETLLLAEGAPLLIFRRNAPGGSAVWNSEWNGAWSAEFLKSPEAAAMFTALARALPDPLRFTGITAWNRSTLRDLDFEFESAESIPELQLNVTDLSDGKSRSWRIRVSPRDTFRFRLPDLPEGIYQIQPEHFMDTFYFVSQRAATAAVPDYARIAEINRTAIAESAEPVRTRLPLNAACAAAAGGFFLLELFLRRRRSASVAGTLLLVAGSLSLHGATFEQQMREGLHFEENARFRDAATCYLQGARSAKNDADRSFAEILARENFRRDGNAAAAKSEIFLPASETTSSDNSDFTQSVRRALIAGDRQRALELYERQIASIDSAEQLAQLSEVAAQQGLFDSAEKALRKALKVSEPISTNWSALFQLSALYNRIGETGKAINELRRHTSSANVPPQVLLTAGDLSEQAGDPDSAMEFYRRSGTEESLMRLAQLAETRDSFDEAAAAWRDVAERTASEMRSHQAVERLVELYRKHGRLDELLTQKQEETSSDPLRRQIHLRALVALNDQEKLYDFLEKHGTPAEELQYRLILRDYSGGAALIQSRLNATTGDGDDISASEREEEKRALLRQQTLIAVELKNADLAAKALRQLATLQKTNEDEAAFQEFSGAILMLTGDYAGSATAYQRAMELAPEKFELLLLWGKALCAAGEQSEVLRFFSDANADETNLERFGVLIDGLLNFNAPRPILAEALQEILCRIERDPETLFYYQLAEDLAEELGEQEVFTRLERLQMIVAPERRSMLVQKCFLDARRNNDTADALFYGRILLAFDDACSPEITRELGTLFVENQLFDDAERCMRNADRIQETDANLTALAAIHAANANYDDAERLYRELLALSPNRIDLLEERAAILELQGRIAEAAECSFQSLRLRAPNRNNSTVPDRQLPHLIRSFANQALFQPEKFRAEIDAEIEAATRENGKNFWRRIRARLDALTLFEPQNTTATRHEGTSSGSADTAGRKKTPPNAYETVVRLRNAAPENVVPILQECFAYFSGKRREFFWRQLVDSFDFEPSPEAVKFLLQEMNDFTFDSFSAPADWQLPFALKLKTAYAEQALIRSPDSPAALELAARMRHLAGDADGARMLAELTYEMLDASTAPLEIAVIRRLLNFNAIYADAPGEQPGSGRAALLEQIALQDEKRELLGDTPFRLLLAGILRTADERYDEAQTFFARAWDADRDAFALLWTLNNHLAESGAWESWAELLLQRVPNDQTARTLYAVKLAPYLRAAGREREALEILPLLNETLQLRERLLLAHESGDSRRLTATFLEFLRTSSTGSYRLRDFSEADGGIQVWQKRQNFRHDANKVFMKIAAATPRSHAFLAYRLQGLLPNEGAFAVLHQTLRHLPKPRGNAVEFFSGGQPPASAATLLLKAGESGGNFSAAEIAALRNFAVADGITPEILNVILSALPADDRSAVGSVAMKKLLQRPLPPALPELEPLMELFSPEERRAFCDAIDSYEFERDSIELPRLQILKRYAPERFAERLNNTYPPWSAAALLHTPPTRETCCNYLLSAQGEFPNWELLAQLAPDDTAFGALTDTFCAALEVLADSGTLSRSQALRHYSLLAVFDLPSRRGKRLDAARRIHLRTTGESSLWLLDALRANQQTEEADQLETQLHQEGKLPPARQQRHVDVKNTENLKYDISRNRE